MPLLQAPAPVAIRRIALEFLDAARSGSRQLQSNGDDEALHDFRVALRRLRSTLRAYRPWLDDRALSRKLRRRIKRMARATSRARDTEVALAWIRRERRYLDDRAAPGYEWLVAELEKRGAKAYDRIRQEVTEDFDVLDAEVRGALGALASTNPAPPFRTAVADTLRAQVVELADELARIASIDDTENIHAARIEAKRLRYLLEPLVALLPHGKALLSALKRFQDEFGELCDRQVLARELVTAAERYGAERAQRKVESVLQGGSQHPRGGADALPGLLALAARVTADRTRRLGGIRRRYLGRRTEAFIEPYRALADELARAAPAKVAPTRRRVKPAAVSRRGARTSVR